ncbi:MAG TPA: hypothetical protein VGF95_14755 [Solirubrobacteraceae bacterium]|jgi:hypothetical protein
MTTDVRRCFEDRLLDELLVVVSENETPAVALRRRRRPRTLRLLAWAAPLAVAGVVFALVSLLGSPRPGLAQAAVIRRASAALAQPKGILYVRENVYGGNICFGLELPIRCIDEAAGDRLPEDRIGLRYRSWMDARADTLRTVYRSGDETVVEGHRQSLYDPANNTLTVITKASDGNVAAFPHGEVDELTIPQIKRLYRDAKDGESDAKLIGKTTVRGIEAYELRIDEATHSYVLLYLDAKTFLPVRIVDRAFYRTPRGLRDIQSKAEVTARMLPVTSANRRLLRVAHHRGAKTMRMTEAQMIAARERRPNRMSRSWSTPGN